MGLKTAKALKIKKISAVAITAMVATSALVSLQPAYALELEHNLSSDRPVLLTADDVFYDQKKRLATASGNVEVVQGEYILRSDKLTYDQANDIVIAKGNVVLLDPDGNVFFADDVRLTDEMRKGIVNHFYIRFNDGSQMAGNKAERVTEDITEVQNAVYSPCPVCTDKATQEAKSPQWQLKAKNVKVDDAKERITYRNAYFEIYGVPVLYTPYFSHATPDASRKTGFLMPTYNHDSELGNVAYVPFYIKLSPSMDATLEPIFTTEEGMVYAGEFRQATRYGPYEFSGSITRTEKFATTGERIDDDEMRGHIEGEGNFEFNQFWTAGFDGKWASDNTYLRRYNFGNEDYLTSRMFGRYVNEYDYGLVEGLAFQGLAADDDIKTTPFAAPIGQYHQEITQVPVGNAAFDLSTATIYRRSGIQSRRATAELHWNYPMITKGGHVFDFRTSVRGDVYSIEDNPLTSGITYDGTEARVIPEARLDWSYPLVRSNADNRVVIEPVVNAIISPNGLNPEKIPNEDSQALEFSDENIFSSNRFTGFDRVEGGPRLNYGLRGGIYFNNGNSADFVIGQSYRGKEDGNFAEKTGLDDNLSDVVGRIGISWQSMVEAYYRFRLDAEDFSIRRNEVYALLFAGPLSLDVNYLLLDNDSATTDREEIYANAVLELYKEWSLSGTLRRDLTDGSQTIESGASLIYDGDCAGITLSWMREFTRDVDIEPSTSVSVQFSLVNL